MKAFGSYHPTLLMIYFISLLLIAVTIVNPVMVIMALSGGICFCSIMDRPKEILNNFLFYIPLFFMIAIINPLLSHNGVTPLFFLNGNPVTLEAILYGLDIAVIIVAVMYWFKCYNRIMTSEKILYMFGKIIPKLSLFLSVILRFIPLFKSQIKKVNEAQKSMGLYSSKSYVDKIRSSIRVFSAILMWSIENAADTGTSMKARGYGLKGRSHFSMFHFSLQDSILMIFIIADLAIVILAMVFNATEFYFYPFITAIPNTPFAWIAYILFGILCFLPFMIEVKENLKWKYYVSKI